MASPIKKLKKRQDDKTISSQNNLKALESTGIFDINFFHKTELSNKIEVPAETLAHAFRIIDPYMNKSPQKSELKNDKKSNQPELFNKYKINFSELKRRIQIINPDFPTNELSLFTGGKSDIYFKELYDLLQDNEINDCDPLDEAIKMFLDQNGNLDLEKFKQISSGLGYPPLENKDIEILKECIDADGDGKISKGDLDDLFKFIFKRKNNQ